jgi:hypothetical protein
MLSKTRRFVNSHALETDGRMKRKLFPHRRSPSRLLHPPPANSQQVPRGICARPRHSHSSEGTSLISCNTFPQKSSFRGVSLPAACPALCNIVGRQLVLAPTPVPLPESGHWRGIAQDSACKYIRHAPLPVTLGVTPCHPIRGLMPPFQVCKPSRPTCPRAHQHASPWPSPCTSRGAISPTPRPPAAPMRHVAMHAERNLDRRASEAPEAWRGSKYSLDRKALQKQQKAEYLRNFYEVGIASPIASHLMRPGAFIRCKHS